ncbi:MAG TPA: DUF401 family protein, partial [Firmicutes bacterium]|nr:DUF401 family protein [Bacillota bacterium]
IRMKVNIGLALVFSGLLTLFAYNIPNYMAFRFAANTVTDKSNIQLLFTIYLIYLLLNLMGKKGRIDSLAGHMGISKSALVFPAMLIGLIPMPGGAMVSAPFVGQIGQNLHMMGEEKAFVNYWFRHVWEFGWPLYPAVILFMNGFVPIRFSYIFLGMLPFMIIAILAGFFMIRHVKAPLKFGVVNWIELLRIIYPIVLLIILYAAFRLNILVSLGVSVLIFVFAEKIPVKTFFSAFRKIRYISMLFLIFGAMFFKTIVQQGEIFGNVGNVTPWIMALFFIGLPLIVGFATGLTVAGVSIAFPVFMALFPDFGLLHVLALYAFVFVGIILSPMHLCLVLTVDYFEVRLARLYGSFLIPAALPLFLAAAVLAGIALWL